jgi:hypothetical protein
MTSNTKTTRHRVKTFGIILAAAAGLTAAAQAADSPWVGTWKLDRARSNFTGDTFTYSRNSKGQYHFSDGSTTNYDFAVDGQEYVVSEGTKVSWKAAGDHGWDSTIRTNGNFVVKVHRELSDADKTLTITATGTKPDGSTLNEESVYTRVTGTTGLVGKWRSIKSSEGSPEQFIVSAPSAGVLHWELPDYQETTEGRMDGSDLPIKGPSVPPGMTFSARFESPNRLAYVLKKDGQPQMYGLQTMAADGSTFTDVSYNAGKQDEKTTGVYVRQR